MQNDNPEQKDPNYYQCLKAWMLPLIQNGPNVVLDMGCATGNMGKKLLEIGKAKEVIGMELFEAAALEASKHYKKVHVGDVEMMTLDYEAYFDYVICGDILEHLKDPYTVVKRACRWLKPGGSILVCLPNVRNYRVLKALVFRGEWEYVSAGIMDRTHLRFFTKSSLRCMVEEAGFEVYHQHMVIEGSKKNFFNRATFGLVDEFLAAQSFCCGRKV